MSNLGWYQRIIEISKKVGGPLQLIIILLSSGVVLGGVVVKIVGSLWRKAKKKAAKGDGITEPKEIFTVTCSATNESGISLKAGSLFKVWCRDKDATLIEVIDDPNNPYCVSATWLRSISSYV